MTDTPANPRLYCTPCAFGEHERCLGVSHTMEPDPDPYRERTRMLWVQHPCSCGEAHHGR